MSGPNVGSPIYTIQLSTTEVGSDDRLSKALKDVLGNRVWYTFYEADGKYIISSHMEQEALTRDLKEKLKEM